MHSISNSNFGPLIAYLVPGATVLSGFSPFSPTLGSWFATAPGGAPTIGGFLYLTVASLAAGMTVSHIKVLSCWILAWSVTSLDGEIGRRLTLFDNNLPSGIVGQPQPRVAVPGGSSRTLCRY